MTSSKSKMMLVAVAAASILSGCKSLPFNEANVDFKVTMNEGERPTVSTGVSFQIPVGKPDTVIRGAAAVTPSEDAVYPRGASKSYLKVNEPLRHIMEESMRRFGRPVEIRSDYRHGDSRQHGKGNAIDVRLYDTNGRPLPAHMGGADPEGTAKHYREYEAFALTARAVQQELYPDLPFRWGGYFTGGSRDRYFGYGAGDTMHFDTARLGMGAGSWERGLNVEFEKAWGIPAVK